MQDFDSVNLVQLLKVKDGVCLFVDLMLRVEAGPWQTEH